MYMAIKIRYGDAIIEADTAEDLKTILSTLGQINGAIGAVPIVERLRSYLKGLGGEHERFLRAVNDAADGLSEEDARAVLGIDRKRLGGLLKGISRRASSEKIDPDKCVLIKDTVRGPDGVRKYHFRIATEMKEAMG